MDPRQSAEGEPESAHYEQSGYSVLGMGAFALALYAGTALAEIELGFITGPGILGIAGVFFVVGTYMVWYSHQGRLQADEQQR